MKQELIGGIGLLLAVAAIFSAMRALYRGSYQSRAGRMVRREAQPVRFAVNLVGTAIALGIGAGLFVWAMLEP